MGGGALPLPLKKLMYEYSPLLDGMADEEEEARARGGSCCRRAEAGR